MTDVTYSNFLNIGMIFCFLFKLILFAKALFNKFISENEVKKKIFSVYDTCSKLFFRGRFFLLGN